MNATLERIRHEVKTLSPQEREVLLTAIDHDLHGMSIADSDGVETAWDQEIDARALEVIEGRVELISGEESTARMLNLLTKLESAKVSA